MIEFLDRVPAAGMANKMTIEYADGTSEQVKITSADNATVLGTAINRANLMAIQGFVGNDIVFESNKITETNSKGEKLITEFFEGYIIETFIGKYTLKKKTTFGDGSITEAIIT